MSQTHSLLVITVVTFSIKTLMFYGAVFSKHAFATRNSVVINMTEAVINQLGIYLVNIG